jgi:hypothetical protein
MNNVHSFMAGDTGAAVALPGQRPDMTGVARP